MTAAGLPARAGGRAHPRRLWPKPLSPPRAHSSRRHPALPPPHSTSQTRCRRRLALGLPVPRRLPRPHGRPRRASPRVNLEEPVPARPHWARHWAAGERRWGAGNTSPSTPPSTRLPPLPTPSPPKFPPRLPVQVPGPGPPPRPPPSPDPARRGRLVRRPPPARCLRRVGCQRARGDVAAVSVLSGVAGRAGWRGRTAIGHCTWALQLGL